MKVTIYGKVVGRSCRKTAKGDLYSIVIEELGQYPSRFQLSSNNASLFGQKDGPFGVGKMVTATAFMNGRENDAKRSDGKPFKAYRVWFTLIRLEGDGARIGENAPAAVAQIAAANAGSEIADDIPF